MHFGKAVKQVMISRKMSVQELADKLGCHRQSVYQTIWNSSAQLTSVESYAKALNLKPHNLVKVAEQY